MPQEFQVLQCFSCQTFQVHQVKKTTKWACKLCGEKQSIKKVYGRGTGADCRRHVQTLNSHRGQIDELKSLAGPHLIPATHARAHCDGDLRTCGSENKNDSDTKASKWGQFVEDKASGDDSVGDNDDDSLYTTNAGDLHARQYKGKKRNPATKPARQQKSKWMKYSSPKDHELAEDCHTKTKMYSQPAREAYVESDIPKMLKQSENLSSRNVQYSNLVGNKFENMSTQSSHSLVKAEHASTSRNEQTNKGKAKITSSKLDSFVQNKEQSGSQERIGGQSENSENGHPCDQSANSSQGRSKWSTYSETFESSSQESFCSASRGDNCVDDNYHGVLNSAPGLPDMRPYVSFDDLETCAMQAGSCIKSPTNAKFNMQGNRPKKEATSSKWSAFTEDHADVTIYQGDHTEKTNVSIRSDKENYIQSMDYSNPSSSCNIANAHTNSKPSVSKRDSYIDNSCKLKSPFEDVPKPKLLNTFGQSNQFIFRTSSDKVPSKTGDQVVHDGSRNVVTSAKAVRKDAVFNIGDLSDDEFDL